MNEFKRVFPRPPSDWNESSLSEFLERVTTRNDVRDNNVLTISAEHGLISQEEFFNRRVASENTTGYFRLMKGDFAYNKSYSKGYPVGAIRRLDRYPSGIVSPLYICFRPVRDSVDSDFLACYLDGGAIDRQLADVAKEGARNHGLLNVSAVDFLAIKTALPPRAEQKVIAQVLQTLDIAIHETEAIIAKLQAVKQGLLHDLLTRGIDEHGELRPPQAEAPHLYKPSPLGWVPKEWDVATLESVSKTVTSGSRDWARFYADSGALFVRIGNLTREHINLRYESTVYVQPPRNADGQRTRLESGDVLISITADLGIVGVVPDGLGEAYINQHIALVRPDSEVVNSRFIGHYLAGPVAQIYISKLNDAGAKAGLNLPTIRSLVTAKPLRHEQDLITTRLDEIDKRIQNATAESAKLRELKTGLMDDLLTGRVRVTPLLEEGAHDPQGT